MLFYLCTYFKNYFTLIFCFCSISLISKYIFIVSVIVFFFFSLFTCTHVFPFWFLEFQIFYFLIKEFNQFSLTVIQFSSVQSFSRVWLPATPWTTACQASLSITNFQSPPKPMSIESVIPSNHLILCSPLFLLPSIFPSIRVFSNESAFHIRWPKYWSFSFNISPTSEQPGLISFRMDWLDLLAVQGTLKSLLQHHSSKASILRRSAFFTVQLSHPCMTTGKTSSLD